MTDDIRAKRVHPILAERGEQIRRNLLSTDGGAPYIEARLTRAPCESETSWAGNKSLGIVGRKERAFCTPYAMRIFDTLTEYIFGQNVNRAGADETWSANVTQTGMAVDQAMGAMMTAWIAGGWAWIGVDRGPTERDEAGRPVPITRAQREALGDRVFWTPYTADQVKDWAADRAGRLLWLITETSRLECDDPAQEAVEVKLRTVWGRGEGTRLVIKDGKVLSESAFTFSCADVPFVLLGMPKGGAHWFDNVESIQAALLNLESLHHENLVQTVFPQLVLPVSTLDHIFEKAKIDRTSAGLQRAIEMVRGLNYPLFEDAADANVSRYLTPARSDLEAIPADITRMRAALFETAGLSLARLDSRQAESADAKMLNRLDAEAGLKFLAKELQTAEAQAVALSVQFDREFDEYDPQYPTAFSVIDTAALIGAMATFEQLPISWPESMKLEAARVFIDTLPGMTPERKAELLRDFQKSIGEDGAQIRLIASGGAMPDGADGAEPDAE